MKKYWKRLFSAVTAGALALSMSAVSFAAVDDTGYSDVDADAWYADAVGYVRGNGLMGGTSGTQFEPDAGMTRAMLATVLYRAAGSPAVSGTDSFTDTAAGTWYSDAVVWASSQGLVTGYGDGTFGTDDPVAREQIAAILWHYAGSPAADAGASFADESAISAYAAQAVDWARGAGIVGGKEGNRFDPAGSATRAEVAAILMRYLQDEPQAPAAGDGANILIAYFSVPETDGVDTVSSASRVVENGEVMGNVEFLARAIQEETGGDLFAIETEQQYPGTHDELLDFAAAEGAANARPPLSTHIDNLDEYDVIFLGYPIWNADLPMPMYTFLDTYDLGGKTVIPFTAHGGSGFAGTIRTIADEEPDAQVETNGFSVSRNSVSEARSDITAWVASLGYAQAQQPSAPDTGSADILIAYFSNTGNTRAAAEQIASLTGGDLAEITRAQPYSDLSLAEEEIRSGARPEIRVSADNVEDYDVIFVGYPIWWNEAPAMIATFLDSYDFSGKTLVPFCTSSSDSIDNSLHIFTELCPEASIADGLRVSSSADLASWLEYLPL